MNLKGITQAEFFAPPITGINPIPIDPKTGELLYHDFLTPEQIKEIDKFVKLTFPNTKISEPSKKSNQT